MNYLLKQATINKLAQTRLAVNYVLRQRYMQKEAIGNPLLDKYYDENGNRNWTGFWSGVPAKKPQPVKGPDGTIYGIGDYVINPENTAKNKYMVSREALGNTALTDALVSAGAGATVGGAMGSTGGVAGFFSGAGLGGGLGYIGGAIEGVGRGLWNQRQAARYLEAERAANEYFKQKGNARGDTQTMPAPSNKPVQSAPNAPKKLLFNPQAY